MKKNYIKIIAAAAIALLSVSCQVSETDLQGDTPEIGKNTIAFSLGRASTRSSVAISDLAQPGAIIPLGTDEMGNNLYLEESVIDLNSPVTRGTPAYTENVATLYDGKLYAYSELSDLNKGNIYEYNSATGYYSKSYQQNIWGVANPLNFWMYMPVDLTNYGVTADPTFAGGGDAAQTISFSYKSPATAAKQADIIFAARSIDEATYNGVMDVLFHHALTGVKFAIGNDEDTEDEDGNVVKGDISKFGIKINFVSFTGLLDSGNCVVTPTTENGEYKDVAGVHSSYANGVVVWSGTKASGNPISSGTFGDELVTYSTGDKVGSFKSEGDYPNSFAEKGNEKNLNDGDATQTFWLIPQTMTDNVKLTVDYNVGSKNYTWTIDFGKALKNVTWKAGQLRTYTIRIDEVNVKIEDEVTINQTTETITDEAGRTYSATSYKNSYKENVTIANTGNTDAFIRAALIGQWLDSDGNPVFGFTDFSDPDDVHVVLVDSWYQDQFVKTTAGAHGTFEGLPGYKGADATIGNWTLGNDGYYYYTEAVAPGEIIGSAPEDDADNPAYIGTPLFTKYTVGSTPAVAVAGAVKDVYFVLEVATQAISAKQLDGSDYTWNEAWKNALNYDPSDN